MLIYYSFKNSYIGYLWIGFKSQTQGFQGTFCNIVIIFGGAYRYRRATCWLKQVSKYIALKCTNSILDIT